MNIKELLIMALLSVCVGLSVVGCSDAPKLLSSTPLDHVRAYTGNHYPPADPQRVQLYFGQTPTQYLAIGTVLIDPQQYDMPRKESSVYRAMRHKAAEIGGNGVIDIHFQALEGYHGIVIRTAPLTIENAET